MLKKFFVVILALITTLSVYAQSGSGSQMSDDRKQKAMQDLKDVGICLGIANAQIKRGGEITEVNKKYFAKRSEYDPFFKEANESVNNCRKSNPQDSALFERCVKQLPPAKQALYEGFLTGNAMIRDAYEANRKDKIGVLLLSCSST